MKTVCVQDAIGMILGHDMTEIVPGEKKGVAFRKGHIIKHEDLPKLLNIGKENIYVMEFEKDDVHEDEAAIRMAKAAAGPGITITGPKEGKATLVAQCRGLLKVDQDALLDMNSTDEIMFASLSGNIVVEKGDAVAGTRVIPLVVKDWQVKKAERICGGPSPVIQVKPFRKLKAGVSDHGKRGFLRQDKGQVWSCCQRKIRGAGLQHNKTNILKG